MRAILLALLLSILIATHTSWGRPYCSADQWWTPDCGSPTIIVYGDVTNVIFSGANIQMTAAPSTPGVANIFAACCRSTRQCAALGGTTRMNGRPSGSSINRR